MGFYFGSALSKELGQSISPTITPREYVSEFSDVIRTVRGSFRQYHARYSPGLGLGLRYLTFGLPGYAADFFANLVRIQPSDELARRLLGIAYLDGGNLKAGAKQLEIAFRILRREVAPPATLRDALLAHYEMSLLRFLLVPLYLRLGRHRAAQLLVAEPL